MKRFRIGAVLTVMLLLLTGCGVQTMSEPDEDKLKIVCTIFPQYDWTKEILGELADDV